MTPVTTVTDKYLSPPDGGHYPREQLFWDWNSGILGPTEPESTSGGTVNGGPAMDRYAAQNASLYSLSPA
jgi:hypothetical protein